MRNILTHEYLDTDLDQVARAVPLLVADEAEFRRALASWLQALAL